HVRVGGFRAGATQGLADTLRERVHETALASLRHQMNGSTREWLHGAALDASSYPFDRDRVRFEAGAADFSDVPSRRSPVLRGKRLSQKCRFDVRVDFLAEECSCECHG